MPTAARAWLHQASGAHQVCLIPWKALRLSRKHVRSQSVRPESGHKLDGARPDVSDPDTLLDDILSCLAQPMQTSPHPTRYRPPSPPMTAGEQSASKQPTAKHGHASTHARIAALKVRAVNLALRPPPSTANSTPTCQGSQGVADAANITSYTHNSETTGRREVQTISQVPPLPVSPPPHATCPAMSERQQSDVVGEHVVGLSGRHHPQSHQQKQQQQLPKMPQPSRSSLSTRQHVGTEHARDDGAHGANISHTSFSSAPTTDIEELLTTGLLGPERGNIGQQDAVSQHVQGPPSTQPHPAPPPAHTTVTVSVPSTRRRRAERVAAPQRPDHIVPSAGPGQEQDCQGRLGQGPGEATAHDIFSTASAAGTSLVSTRRNARVFPRTASPPDSAALARMQVGTTNLHQTSDTPMPTPCTHSPPTQQWQQLQGSGASQHQRRRAVPVGNPRPGPTWAPQLAAWGGSPPVDLSNLASIDSTNWDKFAAALFPMHYQPAYHATLFEFLVDLWPAVGIAETAGRGSTLASAAYSLLCGCWHSHEGAVRRCGVLAYAIALGDNDALQDGACAALAGEPSILAALAVLLPTLHPGEVDRGGLVAEAYAAGRAAVRKLQVSQQQHPPQKPQPQQQQQGWVGGGDGEGEWAALAARLEALQHVHPSAPLGSLGCVVEDYYPLPARGGGLRRAG